MTKTKAARRSFERDQSAVVAVVARHTELRHKLMNAEESVKSKHLKVLAWPALPAGSKHDVIFSVVNSYSSTGSVFSHLIQIEDRSNACRQLKAKEESAKKALEQMQQQVGAKVANSLEEDEEDGTKPGFLRAQVKDAKNMLVKAKKAVSNAESTLKDQQHALASRQREVQHLREKMDALVASVDEPQVFDAVSDELARLKDDEREAVAELERHKKIVFHIREILMRSTRQAKSRQHQQFTYLPTWPFHQIQVVHRARVPVVKVEGTQLPPAHIASMIRDQHNRKTEKPADLIKALSFDIVVNNDLALHNSRLLATYAAVSPLARQLMFLIKTWAKSRGLNDAPTGTLSSYAHMLLVIFFLMTRHRSSSSARTRDGSQALRPLLPNLQDPALLTGPNTTSGTCDGLDISFCRDVDRARQFLQQQQLQQQQQGREPEAEPHIADLVVEYFAFLSWLFDRPAGLVVCIRRGCFLEKRKCWNDARLWRISIEDPFETAGILSLPPLSLPTLSLPLAWRTMGTPRHRAPVTLASNLYLSLFLGSVKPHDLGSVLSKSGQEKIRREASHAFQLLNDIAAAGDKQDLMLALRDWGSILNSPVPLGSPLLGNDALGQQRLQVPLGKRQGKQGEEAATPMPPPPPQEPPGASGAVDNMRNEQRGGKGGKGGRGGGRSSGNNGRGNKGGRGRGRGGRGGRSKGTS